MDLQESIHVFFYIVVSPKISNQRLKILSPGAIKELLIQILIFPQLNIQDISLLKMLSYWNKVQQFTTRNGWKTSSHTSHVHREPFDLPNNSFK